MADINILDSLSITKPKASPPLMTQLEYDINCVAGVPMFILFYSQYLDQCDAARRHIYILPASPSPSLCLATRYHTTPLTLEDREHGLARRRPRPADLEGSARLRCLQQKVETGCGTTTEASHR